MNRRSFLEKSLLSGAALMVPDFISAQTGMESHKLGVALFTLPKSLDQDLIGTLKMISGLGYKEVEFFGPYDYSVESAKKAWAQTAGFLGVSKSGYFGKSPKEIRSILDDLGLSAPSIHIEWDTLKQNMGQIAEAAQVVGHKNVGIAMIPQELRTSLDDYKKIADEFNKVGEAAKKHGLTFFYHNHGYGHRPVDGVVPFQLILDRTDAKLVKMEMDVFWFTCAGADLVGYLRNNPGRFQLLHLKDMTEIKTFSGTGEGMQDWMGMFKYLADAGEGQLDLCHLIQEAYFSGAKHFFLEKDLTATPEKTLKTGYSYLSQC